VVLLSEDGRSKPSGIIHFVRWIICVCNLPMAGFCTVGSTFHYRVTGKQSIERLVPLVADLVPQSQQASAACLRQPLPPQLDFVWETTCEKDLKGHHATARVYNKLNNSQIIESKASFAALQVNIGYPMLDTRVATNATNVAVWAKQRWSDPTNCKALNDGSMDWWVVKASRGNGGRDIWVMHAGNYMEVLPQLPESDEYVIQR
jgi:hypothetical protein